MRKAIYMFYQFFYGLYVEIWLCFNDWFDFHDAMDDFDHFFENLEYYQVVGATVRIVYPASSKIVVTTVTDISDAEYWDSDTKIAHPANGYAEIGDGEFVVQHDSVYLRFSTFDKREIRKFEVLTDA